jgi:hypothetical protein
MRIKRVFRNPDFWMRHSLCLNEIGTNPQDADWRCAAIPQGSAPGMAQINNLAASFARFPLSFVPFMQYAG